MKTLWLLTGVTFVSVCLSLMAATALRAEDDTKAPQAQQQQPTAPQTAPEAPATPTPTPAPPTPPKQESRAAPAEVCCDDGRVRGLTAKTTCDALSGQILPRRFCQQAQTVCCKQGRAEWWMDDAVACNADGGVVADESYCR